MKKWIYALMVPLVLVGVLVFANRGIKSEPVEHPTVKPITPAEREAALQAWQTTPGGMLYVKWKSSPEGKKVLAAAAKITNQVRDSSAMQAVITDLALPPGSRLGFGVMARIDGEDYILSFGPLKSNEFQQLHSLKVNDKIMIRSHSVMHAPKYAYPIVSGDYVERDGKTIYKAARRKGGC